MDLDVPLRDWSGGAVAAVSLDRERVGARACRTVVDRFDLVSGRRLVNKGLAAEDHRRAGLEVSVDGLAMNLLASGVVNDFAFSFGSVLVALGSEGERDCRRAARRANLTAAGRVAGRRDSGERDREDLVER